MQKKKKTVVWIVVAVLVVAVVGGAVWAKQYYQDRYVGSDYYTVVPMNFDLTPETLYDRNGKAMEMGKNFTLMAYDDQGQPRQVDFTVKGDEPSDYPQPGTYLKVSASKQIVVGWDVIDESSVPAKALEQIKAH